MADALLLFCRRQSDEAEGIREQLQRADGGGIIDLEWNAQAGLGRLKRRRYDVIIVSAALADCPNAAVAEDGGLIFCSMARQLTQAPILLAVPTLSSALVTSCNTLPAPAPSPLDDSAILVVEARRHLDSAANRSALPKTAHWQLQITIFADEKGWRYEMRGTEFDFARNGPLTVQRSAWMCWGGLHHSPDHWYVDFAKIGKSIRVCLCEENPGFKAHLETAEVQARSIAQRAGLDPDGVKVESRVTFVVAKAYYRLALEAIFSPRFPEEPWLAHARLTRRIRGSTSERGDMFQANVGPLRALLVCADTDGIVNDAELPGGRIKLKPLLRIQDECDEVAERLGRPDSVTGRRWFAPRNIHRLGGAHQPLTRNSLLDKLADGPWDLIHFAGHSHFRTPERDGELGNGYLFIGSPQHPEIVRFSLLASFLRSARFVYLSSCESGNSSFAVEATDNGIHSVLGYRWYVDDWVAALHARLFYSELMRHLSVETAFWSARNRLYRRYHERQDAWASAMLVTPEN